MKLLLRSLYYVDLVLANVIFGSCTPCRQVLVKFNVRIYYDFGHDVCRQGAVGSKGLRHNREKRGLRES
ncbi:hypothetical protein QL285_024704 [Trifolium repens]|nr:hypothetical protein QL285_024702 [Trifolium repens]KAK2425985.1 hypothetical protein QL285_024704 [Trifolium repens]